MLKRLFCFIAGHDWFETGYSLTLYGTHDEIYYQCSHCGKNKFKLQIAKDIELFR